LKSDDSRQEEFFKGFGLYQRTPLVLGSWWRLRTSRITAILIALANALKIASIL
jgi:hypothetical protein